MRKLSIVVLASALVCLTGACAEQKGKKKDDKKEDKKEDKQDKKDADSKPKPDANKK